MIGVAESIKRVLGDYIYTCTCMCRPTKRVLGDYIIAQVQNAKLCQVAQQLYLNLPCDKSVIKVETLIINTPNDCNTWWLMNGMRSMRLIRIRCMSKNAAKILDVCPKMLRRL